MAWWENFIHSTINQLSLFGITDVIDIALVSYIVYKALKFMRNTRAIQLLIGIVGVIIITQISYFARLNTMYYILSQFFQIGLIAILIVFQPELRRVLERTGRSAYTNLFAQHNEFGAEAQEVIREISKAAQVMSNTRTGALIVIEINDRIDALISSGISISAKASSKLIENIFVPNTPLHDGAVVIRNHRVELASCVLPLTKNPDVQTSHGTRHRAGIGISEESDAVSVIVSEETGRISIAYRGVLTTGYAEDTLRARLVELLSSDNSEENEVKKRVQEDSEPSEKEAQ